MSNKTSDENVISIEEDVKILKYIKNDFDWDLQHPNSRTERELQEAKKYSSAIDNILAELEQKDKRIQDLERKNKHLSNTSDYETISLECTHLEEQLDIANSRIQELEEENRIFVLEGSKVRLEQYIKENFIPKQVVIDLKNSITLDNTIVGGRRNGKILEYGIKLGKIKALQELLEGEK